MFASTIFFTIKTMLLSVYIYIYIYIYIYTYIYIYIYIYISRRYSLDSVTLPTALINSLSSRFPKKDNQLHTLVLRRWRGQNCSFPIIKTKCRPTSNTFINRTLFVYMFNIFGIHVKMIIILSFCRLHLHLNVLLLIIF